MLGKDIGMLIGDDFDPVERRITKALCSGRLPLREAKFLQDISRNIGMYRERATLSDTQASWLFTILTRTEKQMKSASTKVQKLSAPTKQPLPYGSATNSSGFSLPPIEINIPDFNVYEDEPPAGFDLSDAI
jgi:hypothetical protein